jgi:protein TonB
VLVSGTLFLLTSTAPWTPPQIEAEPSTPDAARTFTKAKTALEDEVAPFASDQAELSWAAEPEESDRTYTASTEKEPDEERSLEAETSPPEAGEILASFDTPLDAETADSGEVSVIAAATPEPATSEEKPSEAIPQSAASVPPEPAGPSADDRRVAATAQFTETMTSLAPRVIASYKSEAAAAQIAELMTTLPPRVITSEKSEAATDQIAEVLASLPPAPPVPVANIKVAAVAAGSPPQPLAEVAAVVAPPPPPPPLPSRKPGEAPPAPLVATVSASGPEKPRLPETPAVPQPEVATVPARERGKPAMPEEPKQAMTQQSTGPFRAIASLWKPMALAPADKPAVSLSKTPIGKPSSAAYAGKVWSALARHKPRAGQRGSASVSFAIGQNGALQAVRIARSSGNARIDQLALATVRNAAPFPPPPSGSVSYTIRIDLQ